MPKKTIENSEELARKIRECRESLNMTIAEAANRAGVGARTWSRYEAGAPIQQDKMVGIYKALRWNGVPNADEGDGCSVSIEEMKADKDWPSSIEHGINVNAAASFMFGASMLFDNLGADLEELRKCPKGTHIGQLPCSMMEGDLPEQFLLQYDYEFLFRFRAALSNYLKRIQETGDYYPHTVAEEIMLYSANNFGCDMFECGTLELQEVALYDEELADEEELWEDLEVWPFRVMDDNDVAVLLFSDDMAVDENNCYHFDHWFEPQFWLGDLTPAENNED